MYIAEQLQAKIKQSLNEAVSYINHNPCVYGLL